MTCLVTFIPAGKTVHVAEQTTLLQAATQAGLLLASPCGGGGSCAKCRVLIRDGEVSVSGSSHRLSADELARGWRLACGAKVTGPVTVEVPAASLVERHASIVVDGDPICVRHDPCADGALGVAFDLGTTTVAGALFDLHTGLERATHAVINRQVTVGDDVVSRIHAVRSDPAALAALQRLAAASLNDIICALCDECDEEPVAITRISVAGNTTMQQLLLGIDPSPLGECPFKPAFHAHQSVRAADLGLACHREASLLVFPQVGGFVGGDTVSDLLASHFDSLVRPTLLVDIGTNGEIALLKDGAILAASAAAGPAFEGARISQGMRAAHGAIDQVWLHDGDLRFHVLGDAEPVGLCGSALVDIAALLLSVGLLDESGSLGLPSPRPPALTDALAARLQQKDGRAAFVIARSSLGVPLVTLTQQDVRELQLASGAIRAAIEALLHKAQLASRELDAILLAGGFGTYIRRENAQRIGLLPPVHYLAIRSVGNASLTGAKRALLARAELARAEALRERTTHVDLASEPRFAELFMEHIAFPESAP